MRRLRTKRTPARVLPRLRTKRTLEQVSPRLKIDLTVSLGNVLTLLTIVVSIAALFRAWNQDRLLREKEQADKIRTAAAETSAKLERWEELSLSFFNDIQPAFVQASNTFGAAYDVTATRDELWKELDTKKLHNLEKLLSENIETAYVGLYGYNPAMRPIFRKIMSNLNAYGEIMFVGLHADTEQIVLGFQDKVEAYRTGKEKYQTASMGNALRQVADNHRQAYTQQIDSELKCMQDFLASLVSKSDADLVYGHFVTPCSSP